MNLPSPPVGNGFRRPSHRRRRTAVALVIVLAFVVLLTGLIVAYFARSITGRQLSNSSAGQTKAALLAQSASDVVISGFKREIVAGSTLVPYPASAPSPAPPIYLPSAATYAVPARYPTPVPNPNLATPNDPIPNLVRMSRAGDSLANVLPTPAVASLASAVNSTNDKALNGHIISPARWNSHFLIPRAASTADNDSTPDGWAPPPAAPTATPSQTSVNFVPPDWVLMTRGGPTVEPNFGTVPNAGASVISNPVASNQNYVVGRYAYAIYDEGGLLDMNLAGYPTPTTPAATTGFTATQQGRKGSLALADLTQLPIVRVTPTAPNSPDPVADPGEYLSQNVVNQIVGWRNNLSASPSGTFPNFTFNSTQASNWFNHFANSNMNGFMEVYGAPPSGTAYASATDQAFTSRQQLLHLRSSINGSAGTTVFSANALQYMGTFSRTLEQPSIVPAHIQYPKNGTAQEAPNINAVSTMIPPPASSANSYQGNNDQAGMSTNGTQSAQDVVNAAFLTVRVPTTVVGGRLDGTDLVAGEPLVKRRFDLRRLSWLTYKGPSTNNMGDINVQQGITLMGGDPNNANDPIYQLVAQGTAANIQKYFGLTWGPDPTWGGYVWTYVGHDNNANTSGSVIQVLSNVATKGREADFAELLKASINVGSLAKGGPNLNYTSGAFVINYQYTLDTAVDFNVYQIMANLVDQFDTDSFPTVIEALIPGSQPRAFRGVEDLPYFYRYHPFTVVKTQPSPVLSKSNTVTFVSTSGGANATTLNTADATGITLSNPGEGELLWAPDVWNPHDPNTAKAAPTGTRPSQFRLSCVTDDPISATPAWQCTVRAHVKGEITNSVPASVNLPATTSTALVEKPTGATGTASTAFLFNDAGGTLFREPTLLWRTDAPTGANLTPDIGSSAGPYVDVITGVSYIGAWLGKTPLAFIAPTPPGYTVPTAPDSGGKYLFEDAGQLEEVDQIAAGGYRQYTFRLWYMDPTSGKWVIYDEKYPDLHGVYWPTIILNKLDFTNSQYSNSWATGQISDEATSYDPRVGRFGIGIGGGIAASGLALLEPLAATNYQTNASASNAKTGLSKYTVLTTTRPAGDRGNQVNYSGPCQTSDPGNMLGMRWYPGLGWNAAANDPGAPSRPLFYEGLLSQNNRAALAPPRSSQNKGSSSLPIYYEDADGVGRRAMGAYAALPQATTTPDSNSALVTTSPVTGLEGLPEATADGYPSSPPAATYGVGTANFQSQSRPLILNRPFRSVAEMSYASRGGIWKQLDFFTPESGDAGLLDAFCVDEPLPDALAAGKVNLNTHEKPVLKAILAGAYRDEVNNYAAATISPSTLPYTPSASLTATEVDATASRILSITGDTTHNWRGPFTSIGDIVGRYIPSPNGAPGPSPDFNDLYTYQGTSSLGVPSPNPTYNFAGLSAALGTTDNDTVYTYSNGTPGSNPTKAVNYKIQRMREAAIRPLADCGQTRVWNLLIDVVAQTGRYQSGATALSQFSIDGEKRYWVHVAIDRATGEVIDRQTEEVTE